MKWKSGPTKKTLEQRFWEKVKKGQPHECWEWQAGMSTQGYGHIRINGKTEKAHRVAWTLTRGPIPDGMNICHKCDNPPCVNPDHLFLGTYTDNARDREKKGRGNQGAGEHHHNAKLTRAQVKEIRARLQAGETQTAIAKDYGVHQLTISAIKTGKIWRK